MLEGRVDHRAVRAALAAAARRTRDLAAGITDGARPTAGLAWTLGETAAHIVVGARAFADSLAGDLDGWCPRRSATPGGAGRLRTVMASTLAAEPECDRLVLGRLIVDSVDHFLAVSARLSPDHVVATPWYGAGTSLTLRAVTSLLLGEQLVHGRDLAVTLHRPWPISSRDALLVVPAITAMMPRTVRVERTRHLDLTVAIHLRGGPAFAVRVVRGSVGLSPLAARRPDCHLWVRPVAFLLVGYGRITPLAAMAGGGAVAYGRRPWLGLRLRSLFHDP